MESGDPKESSLQELENVLRFHRSLVEYKPTPLRELPGLAGKLGLGRLLVKDESRRMGLNSFKILGASYAIRRWLDSHPHGATQTFAAATDGNHGRAVARTARHLGHESVIYIPSHSGPERARTIEREGARVVVLDCSFDEAVDQLARDSLQHDWVVISDTGYSGRLDIPAWITAGYQTLFEEALEQLEEAAVSKLDYVLLQGGVGGFASGAINFFNLRSPVPPRAIVVEPVEADCLLESIASPGGEPASARGNLKTAMVCLSCGQPSLTAWPVLRSNVWLFLAIEDSLAFEAQRCWFEPENGDPVIASGESGAAGLGGLLALCRDAHLIGVRKQLGLDEGSSVLVVNTEGPVTENMEY